MNVNLTDLPKTFKKNLFLKQAWESTEITLLLIYSEET